MKINVMYGLNLNTEMYRGFASLEDLARISAPDTYNQDSNPDGLQRDLSPTHARKAYAYAQEAEDESAPKRAWTEILLNVRDPSVVRVVPIDKERGLFELDIREDLINKTLPSPQISRTDGNHRLNFGDGGPRAIEHPLTVSTPFAMTIDLPREAEAGLFMDINDNQKAMNTSHLAHLKADLTTDDKLKRDYPGLWIAERLTEDPQSPWYGRVYKGGARAQGNKRRVNLAALRSGMDMMLTETIKMRSMDIGAKYGLIRIYWQAVAAVYASAWKDSTAMLFKGIGIWTFAQLGADVIDRCLVRGILPGSLDQEMQGYLRQTTTVFDWHSGEDVQSYGGRSGARDAAIQMKARLSDDDVSLSQIEAYMRNML